MSSYFHIDLTYKSFILSLSLNSDERVSGFLESTIRGGFGYTLRSIVCTTPDKNCLNCLLKNNCAYSYLIETSPQKESSRLKKYESVPRPFTMRSTQNGSMFYINLTLIGNSIIYLPYFIYTFNKLGKRGIGKKRIKFIVQRVETENKKLVYPIDNNEFDSSIKPDSLSVYIGRSKRNKVEINFYTPLVIRKNGKILKSFDTHAFFTTLLRRVTNLNAFHGKNKNIDIDPKILLSTVDTIKTESFLKPVNKSRFSTRQKTYIDYSGMKGKVIFKGNVGKLIPLLKAGEILSVGKNTVFGYGAYSLKGD